jgi:type IV pilus assembly protein PilM
MGLNQTLQNLLGRQKRVVGLDIGQDSVKVVELTQAGGELEMVHHGIAQVKSGGTRPREDEVDKKLLQAIADAFESSGLQVSQVCSAVSGESVIVRPIPMPQFQTKTADEYEMAVRGEAKDFIPFEMDDVVFDYQRLGEKTEEEKGKSTEVLIVAVKRDLIMRHLSVLDTAGLDPQIIDVDSIALVNSVIAGSDLDPKEAVVVVNIGSGVTNIAIMRDEMTRFTRDLSFAGANITHSIASEYDISFNEAEKIKIECGMAYLGGADQSMGAQQSPEAEPPQELGVIDDVYKAIESLQQEEEQQQQEQPPAQQENVDEAERNQRVSDLCERLIGDIVSEVKRSLLYYENQLDGESISRVVLSGGTSKMKGLREYFESVLDVPTEMVRPFERIKCPFSKEEAEEKGPLLAVALGLALRNVKES